MIVINLYIISIGKNGETLFGDTVTGYGKRQLHHCLLGDACTEGGASFFIVSAS
jgi:hypothetical protein